jgi:DNA-binding response OmpR family regulator
MNQTTATFHPGRSSHQEAYRLLLIEDNPDDATLIQEILRDIPDIGFDIHWANQLKDGFQQMETNRFDVVLLDLILPDSKGLQTIREMIVRKLEIPVIILTGLDDEYLAIQSLENGLDEYLVKSELSGTLLLRTICRALEKRRPRKKAFDS